MHLATWYLLHTHHVDLVRTNVYVNLRIQKDKNIVYLFKYHFLQTFWFPFHCKNFVFVVNFHQTFRLLGPSLFPKFSVSSQICSIDLCVNASRHSVWYLSVSKRDCEEVDGKSGEVGGQKEKSFTFPSRKICACQNSILPVQFLTAVRMLLAACVVLGSVCELCLQIARRFTDKIFTMGFPMLLQFWILWSRKICLLSIDFRAVQNRQKNPINFKRTQHVSVLRGVTSGSRYGRADLLEPCRKPKVRVFQISEIKSPQPVRKKFPVIGLLLETPKCFRERVGLETKVYVVVRPNFTFCCAPRNELRVILP